MLQLFASVRCGKQLPLPPPGVAEAAAAVLPVPEAVALAIPPPDFTKDGAPPIAFHDNNGHPDVASPWIPLSDNRTRQIRRQYTPAVQKTGPPCRRRQAVSGLFKNELHT